MEESIYLNNCHKFAHLREWNKQAPNTIIEGLEVFFDLRTDQQSDIRKLQEMLGRNCCVLRYEGNSKSTFYVDHYILKHIDEVPSNITDQGKTFEAVALRGTPLVVNPGEQRPQRKTISRRSLIEEAPFLFNQNEHLKRRSVYYP
jgi:hypothetical protein